MNRPAPRPLRSARAVAAAALLLALAPLPLAVGCGDSAPASADGGGDARGEQVVSDDRGVDGALDDGGLGDAQPDGSDADLGGDGGGGEWSHKIGTHSVGELVAHFAPLYYHDTDTGGPDQVGALADYLTAIDYDGDLRHDNNWDNLPGSTPQAAVYVGLVASKTHYFITYSGYHSRDWEAVCLGLTTVCHEGDMESITLVVRRDTSGGGFGQPVLLLTAAHGRISAWSNSGDGVSQKKKKIDGAYDFADDSGAIYSASYSATTPHVRVYIQERGHGPIACRAAENPPTLGWFGFLEGVRCEAGASWDPGFFKGSGLIMRFAGGASDAYKPSFDGNKASVRYGLLSTFDTLWAWRANVGDGKLYRQSDAMTYGGARGAPFSLSQPIGARFDVEQFINDSSTGLLPWADSLDGSQQGDLFLDPAYAFGEAFAFSHTFSLDYDYHPYLPAAVKP